MSAPSNNSPAQIAINMPVLASSRVPRRCIMRQTSQTLEANAVEYAINSNQVKGRINNKKKIMIPDTFIMLLSPATYNPVL
jgi:hypothetical protein